MIAYLGAWHAVAGVLVLVLLRRLRTAAPELALGQASDAMPPGTSSGETRGGRVRRREALSSSRTKPSDPSEPSTPGFVRLLLDGPRTLAHLERRERLLLCAFVCLFFTVLSPSGLLTASLRSRGTSTHPNTLALPQP